MSQNTLVIADGTGAQVLIRLSEAFNTVASLNSGSAEPAETYPFMWWADTNAGLLKIRNSANTGWIEVGDLASANLGLITGSAIGTTVQAHDADLDALSASGAGAQLASYGVNGIGFKNRIINGTMMIDQRNSGASVTPTDTAYTLDRWRFHLSQTAKLTTQQNAGSATPPVGFVNYLGITSSSAYSVLSGDYFVLEQAVEGFNVADLGWGTVNAQSVTISFWVKSSMTGTFGGSVRNATNDRCYPFSYTVSSTGWEQKTVTISGDTSGTWVTTNGQGMKLSFGLGVGSTYSGTAGSWSSTYYFSATGATSVVGTNGATFYITGVQLEKGSTATSFDYRPYGTELALCQRYFNKTYSQNTAQPSTDTAGLICWTASATAMYINHRFPVSMRTAPSATFYSVANAGNNNWNNFADNSVVTIAATTIGTEGIRIDTTGNVSGGRYGGQANFSAEL